MANVQKQKALSLDVKMQILKEVDRGNKTKTEISRNFEIAASTLSTILKNRDKIKEASERNKFAPQRKRLRTAKHVDLESALLIWFNQARSQNAPISGLILMTKADSMAAELGLDFKSSPGWLERFKLRNGLVFKSVSGESGAVKPDMISEWKTSTLPKLLADFKPENIFNADETGLYFRCLPEKTLAYKKEKCSGGKKSKERITVMVACNSDGSEKLPMFVIGKSLKPRCFKNVKKLPVEYTANKKAWMTSEIFENWVRKLDKSFFRQKRKIALVIDNCPAHPVIENLKSMKLIFLPPNTTSVLQPCDQGIIKNLKCHYRKFLLQKYFAYIESKENFKTLNLLDCLHLLNSAWRAVTEKTIRNCYRHSGFFTKPSAEEKQQNETQLASPGTSSASSETELNASPTENELSDIFTNVSHAIALATEITLNDYVAVDDDIATTPLLTDSDIVNIVKSNATAEHESSSNESGDDCEEDEMLSIPSGADIRGMLKCVRRFLESHDDGDSFYEKVDDLEQFVEKKIIMNAKQKQITEYFVKT